ncbi:hypothetical protein QUF61_08355 [Candidatus Venteria ishoeyi]|uniref:hypothetical protein n=1 Tax=Candidatus Venteria ishoeyi TaxID=1899563 RepID=UPI0025A60629|nr:hypothetical protein [Candidatus Venteria ishoeyi]MDM8546493.1 hypothetical protein [Candidatus Venteria ishoeyi]
MRQDRKAVRCPKCHEAFSYTFSISTEQEQQNLEVEVDCRWCKAELIVDLKPYRDSGTTVYRGGGGTDGNPSGRIKLPEEIPAKPKKHD